MFNKEFFPTPANVLDQMGIDCYGKTILEPSAGKGDIVDYLKANGAKTVIACEIHDDLRKILDSKCSVICSNFFKVKAEQVSHVQMIVMNPPFSNAEKHINHAWDIAPEGCEIIALCNMETLNKSYHSEQRKQLTTLISDYGESISLGECFSTAERKTDVEVALIRLFKPATSAGFDYEGFFLEADVEMQGEGIMQYNELRAIVNNYVAAVNCFDRFQQIANEMTQYTSMINFGSGFSFSISYDKKVATKEEFAKEMQRECWKYIFAKMNLNKYVTRGVMSDINKFTETRSNYPFTLRNIYRMFEIIIGTREHTMNRAITEAVDAITRHTHENRFEVEGWKTNSGHMLNKKFIIDYMVEYRDYCGMSLQYGSNRDKIEDLEKALCYITGRNYDEITGLASHFYHMRRIEPNRWYCCSFFEYKCFKKGTMHFKFQREEDWAALNQAYAKIKGQVLPESVWNGKKEPETKPQPKQDNPAVYYQEALFPLSATG